MAPKANKELSKESGAKKKKMNTGTASYKLYLFKVLKLVHPELGISSKAMEVMNSFINDLFEKLGEESCRLAHYNKKRTITSREIQTAVKLVLPPGELAGHAISEGMKTVRRFKIS